MQEARRMVGLGERRLAAWGRDANAPEKSGVADRDADRGHDGAAERDLDQRDAQRHAQVSLAHCGDGQELDGDHDVGEGKGDLPRR